MESSFLIFVLCFFCLSKKGGTVAKNLAAQKNNKALGTDRRD